MNVLVDLPADGLSRVNIIVPVSVSPEQDKNALYSIMTFTTRTLKNKPLVKFFIKQCSGVINDF